MELNCLGVEHHKFMGRTSSNLFASLWGFSTFCIEVCGDCVQAYSKMQNDFSIGANGLASPGNTTNIKQYI